MRNAKCKPYFAFIKTVTAELISYLSKALGKNLIGLFDLRPYTKIITCKKQFEKVEGGGLWPHSYDYLQFGGLINGACIASSTKPFMSFLTSNLSQFVHFICVAF